MRGALSEILVGPGSLSEDLPSKSDVCDSARSIKSQDVKAGSLAIDLKIANAVQDQEIEEIKQENYAVEEEIKEDG